MDADKVNKELRMAFDRAKAWNAIILIDEADAYLTSREKLDLQRTALVSGKQKDPEFSTIENNIRLVFLHRLEYFEGYKYPLYL